MSKNKSFNLVTPILVSVLLVSLVGTIYLVLANPIELEPRSTDLQVVIYADEGVASRAVANVSAQNDEGETVLENSIKLNELTSVGILDEGVYRIVIDIVVKDVSQSFGITESDFVVNQNTPEVTIRHYTFNS